VVDLDRRLDAMKCVPEFSAASRQMGRQTARVAAAIDPDAFVRDVAAAVEAGAMPGHHAVVFGAAIGRTGVAAGEAAAAFLYSVSASLVGAALRLLSLGQLDGQRVLAGLRPLIARLAVRAAASEPDDMWSFVPGLEIAGIRHARLTTRLFRS
jgi:urease accessory protein